MNEPTAEEMQRGFSEPMDVPEPDRLRPLTYLQALVQEKEMPIYAPNGRDLAEQNTYMVQGGDNVQS